MVSIRIRLFLLLIALFITGIESISQEPAHRQLNDGWEFYKSDLANPWEALRTGRPAELPVWELVSLPHCYNAFDGVDPDMAYYQGPTWYRNYLHFDNPFEGGRSVLHFEGAGQKTIVYVAEFLAGDHTGGYDEFTIDLTDALQRFREKYSSEHFEGKVPILIRVDNSRDTEMIPSDLSDFNLYGGIYRPLSLKYLPQVSIKQVHVKTELNEQRSEAEVEINTTLYNPDKLGGDVTINLEVRSPSGKVVISRELKHRLSNKNNTALQFNIQEPDLWSPDNPNLYDVSMTCSLGEMTSEVEERFGLRQFEFVKNGPFKLNGERLLLNGTHRHEDHAGVGAAMTEELITREMLMMKEMGVNFIRLGHYQQSRIVLDLCDELGILVWEEIPWCRGGLGGEPYKQQARRMLSNMINQHYNHPSVIIWGLGNENDWPGDFEEFDQEKIRSFMKELNDLSHALDPSRKTAIRRCDFCKDIVDVYSPSIWAGWYRGKYTDYQAVSRSNMEEVDHFLHVEWGASNHARRHSENPDVGLEHISSSETADEQAGDFLMQGGEARVSRDGDWTESYAVNLIDWHLKEQEKMDWLTGTAYWPFKDFSTPLRPENPLPFVNQKGVVERDFTKKESYYVFQSYWTDKPMVHIYGHSWPTRWGTREDGNMVKVYSNCPEAELFLNGVSQGVRERDSQNFPAAGLRWIVKFKEGENFLEVKASKDAISVEDKITVNFQTQTWGEPAQFLLEELSRQNDTAIVRALVLDSAGVLCLDATEFIRFGLTGDGKMIDNLGTSMGSRKVQLQNGRAMIRVKMNQGSSVISISSGSIPTAFCQLNNKPIQISKPTSLVSFVGELPSKKEVLNEMTLVCDWQLTNMPVPGEHPRRYKHWDWTNAALYAGVMAMYQTSGKKKYAKALNEFAGSVDWNCGPRFRHADDLCIGQTYLELNEIKALPQKIEKVQARIDSLMADPRSGREDWWWCDALYMAPPTMARLSAATGDQAYLDYMNEMWWDATDLLFDPEESLYYRDDRYRIKNDGSGRREPNGEKIFWSRGNGWVMAGICRVLQYMPEDYPDRDKYINLLKQMAKKISSLQGKDGLWKTSLLNPEGHLHGETSGSGFYCFALAWGINQGILEREAYLPAVLKAWKGLNDAVHPNGKLGWVQLVGSAPAEINFDVTEVYGVGAFLLAGSEIAKLQETQ